MTMKSFLSYFLLVALSASGCSKQHDSPETGNTPNQDEEYTAPRSRIAWDRSSRVAIFPTGNYARMIELSNGTYIAVAGGGKGTQVTRSSNKGATWSTPVVVAPVVDGVAMAVPEIMECSDGSLLLTYNPRPADGNTDKNKRYGIRARTSNDRGVTWSDEIFVYDASYTSGEGCWEPSTVQLPSGEIQLFFSNENDYTTSNEQNISMFRSQDGGRSWSLSPEIVSFRAGGRDGMPVPLYLPATDEIILSIEDNGYVGFMGRMRPMIVRSTVARDWKPYVDAASPYREYALTEPLNRIENAGAPYIRKALTGEILLSYQGTEGRDVPVINGVKTNDYSQEMIVAVGDSRGHDFTNRTAPFALPLGPGGVWPADNVGYQGMWNSLSVTSDGLIWAITSTNAFTYPQNQIAAVKGYLLNDFSVPYKTVYLDGNANDWDETSRAPLFIGRTTTASVSARVACDVKWIYLLARVANDTDVKLTESQPEKGDGVVWAFHSGTAPVKIWFGADGTCRTFENGAWTENAYSIKNAVSATTGGYVMECAVTRNYLTANGIPPTMVPVNLTLYDYNAGTVQSESIANTSDDGATWLRAFRF